MKYTLALSGTFDVENYGDLLFPEIFKRSMIKRGLDFELLPFSPGSSENELNGSFNGHVYSIREIEKINEQTPIDAVLIGGGSLIHFNNIKVRLPGEKESINNYKSPYSWFLPALFAAEKNINLLFNLPQVPFEISEEFKPITKEILKYSKYISFRDSFSAEFIKNAYSENETIPEITVCPDSVCCISDLIKKEELKKYFEKLNIKKPYAVLHLNLTMNPKDREYIAECIKYIKSQGLEVVMLPLGYTHRDEEILSDFNNKTGKMCFEFDRKLSVFEMISVLANSQLYVGTSFHGAVTALSYGIPAISYNSAHPYKNIELFRQFEIEQFVTTDAQQLSKLAEMALNENIVINNTEVQEKINRHFDRIYNYITEGNDKKISNDDICFATGKALIDIYGSSQETVTKLQTEIKKRDDSLISAYSKINALNYKVNDFVSTEKEREKEAEKYLDLYLEIKNSKYWKLTAPARLVTGKLKKLLNKLGIKKHKAKKISVPIVKYPLREKAVFGIDELQRKTEEEYKFEYSPKISIVVPLFNTPLIFLKEMVESVKNQTYKNWELCLADGSDGKHLEVENYCEKIAEDDKRVKYKKLEKNEGISENTNRCIEMSTGEFIALFDHDDILAPSALFEVVRKINEEKADFVYTDEAVFESPDIRKIVSIHNKPDFAPDNLKANNFICHFTVFDKNLLSLTGGFRKECDGSQDHDLMLRLTDKAEKIVHIPKILYFWRSHPNSVASDINSKTYAIAAGIKAVKDNIESHGMKAEVKSSKAFPAIYEIKYEIKSRDKVSIIIPNKNHRKDIERSISSIFLNTSYENFEIIIVDNGSDDKLTLDYYDVIKNDPRVTILKYDIEFNYSKLINFGVKNSAGDYIVLLNSDIEIVSEDWIEQLLMYSQRDDVGAVGGKICYPDNTIQNAGTFFGTNNEFLQGSAFYKISKNQIGYMGRLCYSQNVSAVSGAFMMMKKDIFQNLSGMDEHFVGAYGDTDLCLRIRKTGKLIVWTPFAEIYHYEVNGVSSESGNSVARRNFKNDFSLFKNRWESVLEKGDPYYNPNFSGEDYNFTY